MVATLGRRHLRPKAPRQASDKSRVDVNRKGSLGQSSVNSAGASQKKSDAVTRQESSETQKYVRYQDMEIDDDKSLEEIGFVPVSDSAGWGVKYTCDKKCNKESFKFL